MYALPEGTCIYDGVIADTGIDPRDRMDLVRGSERWRRGLNYLRKARNIPWSDIEILPTSGE